jgi:hypothetical protein
MLLTEITSLLAELAHHVLPPELLGAAAGPAVTLQLYVQPRSSKLRHQPAATLDQRTLHTTERCHCTYSGVLRDASSLMVLLPILATCPGLCR